MAGATAYVDSYYSRTLDPAGGWPALDGDLEAEVCVVGGGLAGLNTALGLAERGVKVALIEARRIGWGASGRSGGFVGPGFPLLPERLVERVGRARARELYDLTRQAQALIESRIERYGIDCGPLRRGSVAANWFADEDLPRARADYMNELFDAGLEFWPKARLAEHYLTTRYRGGVFQPAGLQLNPLNFSLGIARAAAAAGARLFEASPATQLRVETSPKRVTTPKGTVRADQVVVACSGYIGDFYAPLARATLPVATYVMATEPLGNRLAIAIRAQYGVSDNRTAQDYYRPLADGRLLWGGLVSCFRTPPARLAEVMRRCMLRVYPQLAGVRVEVAWDGLMGYARHRMPQIGQLSPGLWYCMGFGGRGMASTTMGGELIASAIAENDERWRLFEPFGLDYAGGPFRPAIAQAAYWGYQLRDWWRS
jgi:gamma-glutamylputrescine oxidase